MENPTKTPLFSVSDFISATNQVLECAYPCVYIEGEVASFKVNQQKYVFFDLKDAGASVGCFMTVWQLRVPVEDGMKVIVTAVPKLTQWGKFSLTVQSIRPSGEGSLRKSYELLKAKLDREGLFSPERKRPLPSLPTCIGVISSVQAAGYADFMRIVNERWGGLDIQVANVAVQGAAAADQIIHALDYFNESTRVPDVVVIIRGGGSADDLSVFNDEPLVRAVASSRAPVLVGVGHEVDEVLCDFAADIRAATPTHAAHIVVPDRCEKIHDIHTRMRGILPRVAVSIDERLRGVRAGMLGAIASMGRSIDDRLGAVAAKRRLLVEYDPSRVLERGYAIVRGDMTAGSIIGIETAHMRLRAEVCEASEK